MHHSTIKTTHTINIENDTTSPSTTTTSITNVFSSTAVTPSATITPTPLAPLKHQCCDTTIRFNRVNTKATPPTMPRCYGQPTNTNIITINSNNVNAISVPTLSTLRHHYQLDLNQQHYKTTYTIADTINSATPLQSTNQPTNTNVITVQEQKRPMP